MHRLLALCRNLFRRRRVARDLEDELRATFDLMVDERRGAGFSDDQARRAARRDFGSLTAVAENVRDVRAGAWTEALLQDVRYAVRMSRRTPGFTLLAILTLALGIGANAAIFGVVKSVLLDALPYEDPGRLVRVYGRAFDGSAERLQLTGGMVNTIASGQRSFERLGAFSGARDAVFGDNDISRLVTIAWIEPALLNTLGVSPALGRTFGDDDRATGYVSASGSEVGVDTARAVILSHNAWQRLFSGDPTIVGREVRINAISRFVIGVLPRDFVGPMGPADFYLAFDLTPSLSTGANWLSLVGRLKPGVTLERARTEVAALWAARDRPQDYSGVGLQTISLRDAMVGSVRLPLLVLLASTALVLLMACANLAGTQLSRGLARRKEFAVRIALGAGRRRLARQLLTESAVLALAGGAAGLLLAQWLLSALSGLVAPILPAYARFYLDPGSIGVAAAITVCTALAFGMVPALSAGQSAAHDALGDEARGSSEGRRPRRLRGALVALQIALCTSLLAGTGLLTESLWTMATTPLGFDSTSVLTARFRLSTTDYATLDARAAFHRQVLERVQRLPGVDSVAIANKIPTVDPRRDPFVLEGAPANAVQPPVVYASVSDDYFRTLRIPLLQGRTFAASDRTGSPGVAVISENLARQYWPRASPLGARVLLGGDPVEVIGVVGNVRNDLALIDAEPMAYRTHRQESTQRLCVLIRTRGAPLTLLTPLEREIGKLDAALPVQQAMSLDAAVGEGLASRRLPVMLMLGFSVLALLLGSVGVYGMFASMAAAREREFGIRMALGSSRRTIAALMLKQGAGWMAAGLAAGASGTLVVVQLLGHVIDGVPPFDLAAVGGALALLVGAATTAMLIPTLRATRVDPLISLRGD